MNCQYCKTQMKPLFSGFFCPNDCDRKCQRPPPNWKCSRPPGHDGPCAATIEESSRIVAGSFRKSSLWSNTRPNMWSVCCPYCMLSGYGPVDVIMGPGFNLPPGEYDAVCRGKFAHKMVIIDDSPVP